MEGVELNKSLRQALDLALGWHSFVLLGSAGTGKLATVAAIIGRLRSERLKLGLTCSTGIASQVYDADL